MDHGMAYSAQPAKTNSLKLAPNHEFMPTLLCSIKSLTTCREAQLSASVSAEVAHQSR